MSAMAPPSLAPRSVRGGASPLLPQQRDDFVGADLREVAVEAAARAAVSRYQRAAPLVRRRSHAARAERYLRRPRHAELAHDKNIKGYRESQRDTDRHGYTAADETEDGDVGSAPVRGQFVGEEIAGVCAVEVPGHVSSVCSLRMVARVSRALACAGQVLDGLVMDRYRLVPAAWLIACGLPLLSAG